MYVQCFIWKIKNNRKIAICRKKYNANVKNVIAKRGSKPNQSKSLTKAIVTMVFRKYDVTLTISLKFSLRVAKPLRERQLYTNQKLVVSLLYNVARSQQHNITT